MHFAPTFDPGAILAARDAGHGHSATTRAVLLARLCGEDDCDALDWPIGLRDARLIALRRAWFGERIECLCACESCGEPIEIDFEASQIAVPSAPIGASVEVTAQGRPWTARVPTSRDLLGLERMRDMDDARARLLSTLLPDADGPEPEAVGAIATALAQSDPQAEVLLDLRCPACGAAATVPFDIAMYLWEEVDRWAEGTLDEVHMLARAYGWSEQAILALPASRRAAYIERAAVASGMMA
ncbi:hypothetical protein [Novosphingobium sp. 9U]|uniref:hypothetical protein n=1 Tax=Novosphingobium sp. 9U TaxID=2653158 RepID=UPI0012EEFD7C|nr:hypothetical protein [Novosphingobium sp. 9U]VWX50913.1 conserved hypothetical protein [Novosphingobium sp. 9U]